MTRAADELIHRRDAATRYRANGWPIIPTHGVYRQGLCTCGNERCDRPGKHPARTNYRAMAADSSETLASRWTQVPFNIALLIPPSMIVVDVDDSTAFPALQRFGPWPLTPTSVTSRGGCVPKVVEIRVVPPY